ncbi:MAG TPA: insulinase family protein [Kofleriaceae bacterium]|nr:insulinase family protein [Kofleriaceae bacterium]
MKKLSLSLLAAFAAFSCGPKASTTQITPTLPGEGTEHTAKPPVDTTAKADDPWANRKDLITSPAPKAPQKLDLPPVDRFTLPNGLQVMVVQDKRLPVVSMQLAIKAGRADEPHAHMGVSEFTADMLVKGTKKRKALDIAKAVDFVGGGVTVDSSYEATVASCKVMSKNLSMCLDVLPDIIINPTFPPDEMVHVRQQLIAGIRQRYDDAGTLASIHVQNLLWGDEHVRGFVLDEASVAATTPGDLKAWHDVWYSPSNSILAIAGDVDPKQIKAQLTKAFGGWKNTKTPPHMRYADPKMSGVRIRLVDKPHQSQTHIRVAQMGIRHDDPRFFDSMVWNYVLGGGEFSSRLMNVVRAKGGKTYGASSTFDRNLDRGSFVAQTFTRNSEAIATTKLVIAEIAKMAKDGPTDAEVADAIANIAGSYGVRFESASDVTGALLGAELHGFTDAYIEEYALRIGQVTSASAKDAAHEVLDPNNYVIVLVGDASEIEPQLKAEGWKYEKVSFTDPIGHPPQQTAQVPPPSDKDVAVAKKVLDDALAAKGGEAKLRALKSVDMTAAGSISATQNGQTQSMDVKVQRRFSQPDKIRVDVEIHAPMGTLAIAYAVVGKSGWQQTPQGVVDIPTEQLMLLAEQEWTDPEFVLLRFKDKGVVVRPLPDQKVDGVDCSVVNVTSPDQMSVAIFIDKKTHLIKQLAYPDQGGVTFDVFDDYKAVDGIQVAQHRVNKNEAESIDLKVSDIKLNGKLGDDLFARPKGPTAAPAPAGGAKP